MANGRKSEDSFNSCAARCGISVITVYHRDIRHRHKGQEDVLQMTPVSELIGSENKEKHADRFKNNISMGKRELEGLY